LRAALDALPDRPIYEGVFRYVYLLARKANDAAAIAVCENSQDFVEHFSLNVHLLPSAVQNSADVARVKSLLADFTAPIRLRRVAMLLVRRLDTNDLLNITVLRDHLNELETADHTTFVRSLFAHRNDYDLSEWRRRVNELIRDVTEGSVGEGLGRRDPEWLAFFLHASSLADWSEQERVSRIFRDSMEAANCREAVELVRVARAEAVRVLISEIEDAEETGR
jgi:hypothetical protein